MIKSITSVKVTGRRVILRAGFDVPLIKNIHTEKFEVEDDTRIKDCLPTINYLIENEAKIVIVSHLGRPAGWEDDKTLLPVAYKLGELLGRKVVITEKELPRYDIPHIYFLKSDITKFDYSGLTSLMQNGDILFLENVRFYPEEEENDQKFIEILTSFADIFVNDAFSVSHRKEASTFGIAQKLPSYAGLGLIKDIKSLSVILKHPNKPMVVLMGGVKIADKIETIHNLAKNADYILIGGVIANSFLKAAGFEVGRSKVADEFLARELLRNYKDKIILPVDVVVAKSVDAQASAVKVEKIKSQDVIWDIGPETIRKFAPYIKAAKTLVWNGPFGFIEKEKFAFGSKSMAHIFASRSKGKAFGVVGGGETVEIIDRAKVTKFIDHVSTGGGAMLEFLAGKELPGLKVLERLWPRLR